MDSVPPVAVAPPARPRRVASEKSICDPCRSIVPPLLSEVSGTVRNFHSGAVSPLFSGTWIAPTFPSDEGETSNVAEAPETSSTAPELATMLPLTEIVPPADKVPVRRPYGSGVSTAVPAVESTVDDPITTVGSAAVARAASFGATGNLPPPEIVMLPPGASRDPCMETVCPLNEIFPPASVVMSAPFPITMSPRTSSTSGVAGSSAPVAEKLMLTGWRTPASRSTGPNWIAVAPRCGRSTASVCATGSRRVPAAMVMAGAKFAGSPGAAV